MNTKNIFKALAAAMLMPAMLLTASCSNEDLALNNPDNNTVKKGYTLPVTVNVTRQGDNAGTRATYNGIDKKLEFSAGDKLFVNGMYNSGSSKFAGTLTWQSGGTFSGTISTQTEYTKTYEELFAEAGPVRAYLLPNGYGDYGYLSINDKGTADIYDDGFSEASAKAFASDKATAVEQFSLEYATSYSSGFALAPQKAILSFTITGLAASTSVAVVFNMASVTTINESVTTDASGTATFAIGVSNNLNLNNCSLTVGGNEITLVSSSTPLAAGKIYNITRTAAAAPAVKTAAEATAEDIGKLIGADGNIYADVAAATAASTTAVAMIAYVGTASDCSHGLAIALTDETGTMNWSDAGTACSSKTAVTVGNWRLPSIKDWQYMFIGCGASGSYSDNPSSMSYSALASKLNTAGGAALLSDLYWSSTELSPGLYAWTLNFGGGYADFYDDVEYYVYRVRACLAF